MTIVHVKGDATLILLLGGSGYIGSHLMLELHGKDSVEKGKKYQVAIIDLKKPNPDAVRLVESRASGLEVLIYIRNLEGDLDLLPSFSSSPYCAIMLAALKDVNEGEREALQYLRRNITLCLNSMEYLLWLGVKRLIQASSSTVYHADGSGVAVGNYGYSKQVSEEICRRLRVADQELLILRYMNPMGSHPDVKLFPEIGVCQKLCRLEAGDTFVNRGDCIRDYIHITDLAAMHTEALIAWGDTLFRHADRGVVVLNVGTGIRTSVDKLLSLFIENTGKHIEAVVSEARLPHEGFDTIRVDSDMHDRIPNWASRPKKDLPTSLRDYQ